MTTVAVHSFPGIEGDWVSLETAKRLEAKVEEQRSYIDLLGKAGSGSEERADRLLADLGEYQRLFGDLPPGVPRRSTPMDWRFAAKQKAKS